jgi:hypothetical protein
VARYRIVRWRQIPSLVEAWAGGETVHRPLSPRFHDLIDAVAMREGVTDEAAYLEGWDRDPEAERPGDAAAVAEAVAVELEASFMRYAERHLHGR